MRLVSTIPADVEALIVQFDPNWRISALLPPKERELKTAYGDGSKIVKAPAMLVTHTVAPNLERYRTIYAREMKGHNYHVMVCEPNQADGLLRARGWPIGSHTAPNGAICWGHNEYPKDLRHAMLQFWNSTFSWNPDDKTASGDFSAISKAMGMEPRDVSRRVLGNSHVIVPGRADIVIISSDEKDILLAPEAAKDGPSIPADDLYSYMSGGYGSDSANCRETPLDYEEQKPGNSNIWIIPEQTDRPIALPKEIKKVLVGYGFRQENGTYKVQFGGTVLKWDAEKEKLSKIEE